MSIEEILEILSGKGRSLILIFLSLPFCQPIPLPGLSILFGIVIALIGVQMMRRKRLWLPKRILLKTISSATIEKITRKGLHLMNKIKRFMHSRISWLCNHGTMAIVNGFLVFLLGILLALPLPIPLTNLAAGWSLFLVSIGLLEEDGVFVMIGYLISLFTVIFFVLILLSIRIVL